MIGYTRKWEGNEGFTNMSKNISDEEVSVTLHHVMVVHS